MSAKNATAVDLLLENGAVNSDIQVESFSRLIHMNEGKFLIVIPKSKQLGDLRGNSLKSASEALIATAKHKDIEITMELLKKVPM